jgi:hypothetical protein
LKEELILILANYLSQSNDPSFKPKIDGFSNDELDQLCQGLTRMKSLANFASENGLKILVDAEYTYMNDGISTVALALMSIYNKSQPLIGNTYQCYLKVLS